SPAPVPGGWLSRRNRCRAAAGGDGRAVPGLGIAVAEDVQDGLDGDDVLAAERDDADACLLPFPGVRHLVGPGPGDAEDLPEGGQVGGDAEGPDRLGGPRAHQISMQLLQARLRLSGTAGSGALRVLVARQLVPGRRVLVRL